VATGSLEDLDLIELRVVHEDVCLFVIDRISITFCVDELVIFHHPSQREEATHIAKD
jgi:hypothetical protein